jgi:hypothetical protein
MHREVKMAEDNKNISNTHPHAMALDILPAIARGRTALCTVDLSYALEIAVQPIR